MPDRLTHTSGVPPHPHVRDVQRARIVAAMVEIAAERGFAEATVARVVRRAGVSRRTFDEIFEGHEECFVAAFESAIARASEYLLLVDEPRLRWRERIRAGLLALLSFLDDEPSMGRLLIVQSLGGSVCVLGRRSFMLSRIAIAIDEGGGEAGPGNDPPRMIAEGIAGAVVSVIHDRMIRGESQTLLDLANPLTSLIVLPYLGPAAARMEIARPPPRRPERPPASAGADLVAGREEEVLRIVEQE